MNHHDSRARNGMAFGVDPTRPEFYSLRQSRYDSLAFDIARLAGEFAEKGQRMVLLDIGPWDGASTRHLEPHPQARNVDYSVADLKLHPQLHKPEGYSEIFLGNLMEGYPQIASERYDVVVCEQVLEHLTELDTPIKTLARVLKPGGTLFVGVPIFPNGIHLVREYGLYIWDRIFPPNKVRGHVESFSKRKITRLTSQLTDLEPRLTQFGSPSDEGAAQSVERSMEFTGSAATLTGTNPDDRNTLQPRASRVFTRWRGQIVRTRPAALSSSSPA